MNFHRHYQQELAFLRESGRIFANAHPDSGRYLAEAGADPDIERLLEGTAFLTGRIRQQLEDGLPEVTHALIDAFLPHYLRPLPAMTLVQFSLGPHQRDPIRIASGAALDAQALDGTQCRFRTVQPVVVTPLSIDQAWIEPGPPPRILLRLRLPEGATPADLGLERIRLHLGGETPHARALRLCLLAHDGITVQQGDRYLPSALRLEESGFAPDEPLLPLPAAAAESHRLLLEWFAFPQRFQAVDLLGFDQLSLAPGAGTVTLAITCERHARHLPTLTSASFQLHVTPAVNLFPTEAEPLTADGRREALRVRAVGGDPRHLGVFAITAVEGRMRGSASPIPFVPRLAPRLDARCGAWHDRRRSAAVGGGTDVELLVELPPQTMGPVVLTASLLATNRDLPTRLAVGDLRLATRDIPAGITFRNLSVPTSALEPTLGGDHLWRLLSHLHLDAGSVLTLAGLRGIFALYDLRAAAEAGAAHLHQGHQRLAESLQQVQAERATRQLDGAPIRGLAVTLTLDEDKLGGPGDAHLLGSVLDHFIAAAVSLNAFTRLIVHCSRCGLTFRWHDRLGQRRLL